MVLISRCIKYCYLTFCNISLIYSTFLSSLGCFPSSWKRYYVVPLPKVRSPNNYSDYRPISLTCTSSKSLERCVHDQIIDYLIINGIVNQYQTAFREGLNTQDAVLKLCDDIRSGMDDSMTTIAVFFNFSKAFDSIIFDILIYKLKAMGFEITVIDGVISYLRGRQQSVRIIILTLPMVACRRGKIF